jgi:hypothetical protein
MISALFCQLSCPLMVNEVALADILSEALPYLKLESIFLISSETSLLWISNLADASHLLMIGKDAYLHFSDLENPSTMHFINANIPGCVALNENVSAIFAIPENIPSNFVEICPNDASCLLELSVALKELANDATLYVQNSKILLKFPSQSTAVEFNLNLKTRFSRGHLIESVHQVTYAEHSFVHCERLQGTTTDRNGIENLKKDRKTLKGDPRPCIVRLTLYPQTCSNHAPFNIPHRFNTVCFKSSLRPAGSA